MENYQLSALQIAGLATEWGRKFWDMLREKASDVWINEKLLGIFFIIRHSTLRLLLTLGIQGFQFQIPIMAKIHPDHSASKELRSLLPHETFIITPLLEGKWIKISGSDGSVNPDWRDDGDIEIVKLTRTLDAFQHFVLEHSNENLIITDLQGCPMGYPYGSVKIFPRPKLHIRMQIKMPQNLAIY